MATTLSLHDIAEIEVGFDHRVGTLETRLRRVTFRAADGSKFEVDAFGAEGRPIRFRLEPKFEVERIYYDEPEPEPNPRADEANERNGITEVV